MIAETPTACATYPHVFDDDHGVNQQTWHERVAELRWLRATCAACPVLDQCRALLFDLDVGGFVAGMTERERRAVHAQLRLQRPASYLPVSA